MNKKMGLVIVGIIVIVGAFYIGVSYGKKQISTTGNQSGQAFGQNGGMRIRNNGGFGGGNSGEILSKDAQSITLKLRTGGSKIIFYTDKTLVQKEVDGTLSDLIVGKQVSINGTANTDGSLNAQSIQIRPNMPTTSTTPLPTN